MAVLLSFSCGNQQEVDQAPPYTLPAEWEPHEAVWFSYSGLPTDTVLDHMVRAMDPSTRIVCVADGDSISRAIAKRWENWGIPRSQYTILAMPDTLPSPVVRDAGPIFLRRNEGGLSVLDADWNYYGDHDNFVEMTGAMLANEDSFPSQIARKLGLPVVMSDMVIEGGALEVNGAGTLMQVESVAFQRNPGWSRDSMVHELKRLFGVKDIIWLKEGVADDMWFLEPRIAGDLFNQGTGGHIDEFCRFMNDTTILLAWPDDADIADEVHALSRKRMEENLKILENSRTVDGRKFNIVKVPTPDTEYRKWPLDTARGYDRWLTEKYTDLHSGDTIRYVPAASYINYLVTNQRVFLPAYWHEGLPLSMKEKDARVQAIFEQWFPGRKIVPIDPRAINRHGGGMHCWTQQQRLDR